MPDLRLERLAGAGARVESNVLEVVEYRIDGRRGLEEGTGEGGKDTNESREDVKGATIPA